MKTQIRNNPVFRLCVGLVMIGLTSLACAIGGINIGKNSATIDVTLNQDQINQLLSNATVQADTSSDNSLLDKITSVEMHDGFIRTFGTKTQPDGTELSGSYDVSFGVENGALKVKIIAVDLPGVDLNDPRIVRANQEMEKGFTEMVTESNGDVLFKEAIVKDGVLKLTIQVNFNTK